MRMLLAVVAMLCFSATMALAGFTDDETILRRGDANADGSVNQTDSVYISNYLYKGGPAPPCMNQADANDDGVVNLSDSTHIWQWLYQGGSAPPPPGPFATECSADPEPFPGCATDPGC